MGNIKIIVGASSGKFVESAPLISYESDRAEFVIKDTRTDDFPRYIPETALEGESLVIYTVNENSLPEPVPMPPHKWLFDGAVWALNPEWVDEPDEEEEG